MKCSIYKRRNLWLSLLCAVSIIVFLGGERVFAEDELYLPKDDEEYHICFYDAMKSVDYPLDVKKYINYANPDSNSKLDLCNEVLPITGTYAKQLNNGSYVIIDVHITPKDSDYAHKFNWTPVCSVYNTEVLYPLTFDIESVNKNEYVCSYGGTYYTAASSLRFTYANNELDVKEFKAEGADNLPTGKYKKCYVLDAKGQPILTSNGNIKFKYTYIYNQNYESVTAKAFNSLANNPDFIAFINGDSIYSIEYKNKMIINNVPCSVYEVYNESRIGDYYAVDNVSGATYSYETNRFSYDDENIDHREEDYYMLKSGKPSNRAENVAPINECTYNDIINSNYMEVHIDQEEWDLLIQNKEFLQDLTYDIDRIIDYDEDENYDTIISIFLGSNSYRIASYRVNLDNKTTEKIASYAEEENKYTLGTETNISNNTKDTTVGTPSGTIDGLVVGMDADAAYEILDNSEGWEFVNHQYDQDEYYICYKNNDFYVWITVVGDVVTNIEYE